MHREAAKLLDEVKNLAFDYLKDNPGSMEYEVQGLIIDELQKRSMDANRDLVMVAFRGNTEEIHNFPSKESKGLKEDSNVWIDIWSSLDMEEAPFADITWMGYHGNEIPKKLLEIFNIVIEAREKALNYLENNLNQGKIPKGKEVDKVVKKCIKEGGYGKGIKHNSGHPLGIENCHGDGLDIYEENSERLERNLGYALEPGIYLEGTDFGARSEINFIIRDGKELEITTPRQFEIVKI